MELMTILPSMRISSWAIDHHLRCLRVPASCSSEVSRAIQVCEDSHFCLVLLSNSTTLWGKKCGLLIICFTGCLILHPVRTERRGSSPGAETGSLLRQQSGKAPCSFCYVTDPLLYAIMHLGTDLGIWAVLCRNLRECFQIVGTKDLKRSQPHMYAYIYTHMHTHTITWWAAGRKAWKYVSVNSFESTGLI